MFLFVSVWFFIMKYPLKFLGICALASALSGCIVDTVDTDADVLTEEHLGEVVHAQESGTSEVPPDGTDEGDDETAAPGQVGDEESEPDPHPWSPNCDGDDCGSGNSDSDGDGHD